MHRIVCLFLIVFSYLLPVSPVIGADFIQRVFNARDGLANTVIHDIYFDRYGYTWLATAEGLYRVSNNSIRRIDKMGRESVLTEQRVYSIASVNDDYLLLTSDNRLYLYNIPQHVFTEIFQPYSSEHANEHWDQDTPVGVASIVKYDENYLAILGKDGTRYLFNIQTLALTFQPLQDLTSDIEWVSQLVLPNNDMLFAAVNRLELHTSSGQVVDFKWHDDYGVIKGMLYDSQQRLWLYATKGLFQLDVALRQIIPISDKNFYIESMVADDDGLLWLGSRSGLFSWNVATNETINYKADLKLQANIDYIHALAIDSNQLIWVGGSGDGLALAATKPDFLLDVYSQDSPYYLKNEMIWAIHQHGEQLWLGTDGSLEMIEAKNQPAKVIVVKGLEVNDSIYQIDTLDDSHISLSTTNGIFVVNTETFESGRFAWWSGGEKSLRNKVIYMSYKDPLLKGRIWFVTNQGIYFWEPGAADITQLIFSQTETSLNNIEYRVILRDKGGRLWTGGVESFGYFDVDGRYITRDSLFKNIDVIPRFFNFTEVGDGILWLGTSQHGLFEYNFLTGELLDLDKKLNIDCSSTLFFQVMDESYLIGCSSSIIEINKQTNERRSYTHKDGFISHELNEAAIFYQTDKGLYIGTPDGAMLIDPYKLSNRINNDQAFLESVSVYYDDKTDLFLLPENLKVIQPGASLVSFQISDLDYLDDSPMGLQYRLLRQGEEPSGFVLLEGQSQINISGLRAGEYTLELLYKNRSVWSDKPLQFSFTVAEFWWQSQLFRSMIIFMFLLVAFSVSFYHHRQVKRFKRVNEALIKSDDRLSQALKGSDSDLWEWRDNTQKLTLDNRSGLLGSQTKIVYRFDDFPIHPEDVARVTKAWLGFLKSETNMIDVEHRYLHDSGSWRWFRVRGRATAINPMTNRIISVAGIYTDITSKRELESEVHLFAEAFKNTSEGMLILDAEQNIKVSNQAANKILGLSDQAVNGKAFTDIVISSQVPLNIDKLFTKATFWSGERALLRADEMPCPVWLNISKMQDISENILHYVVVFSDITDRKQNEIKLQRLANTDALTGVANRSQFLTTLNKIIKEASDTNEKLALLFLDLDRFKSVNDSYGHSMGDALLVEASNRLQSCLSSEHILCRFGGDEFVILLRKIESLDAINHIANKLLQQIQKPFRLYGREFFISTSIGICCWPDDCRDPETLIKNADLAMYHAKDEGRGNFQYYSAERNTEALYHLRLESDLRKAIERNEFELYYQPQIDILHNDRFIGMEALIRWQHPIDGFIRPDVFIQVAESCGLIIDIDSWVLKQACLDGMRWHQHYDANFKLSVNVSAVHFGQNDFIRHVKNILDETGFPAAKLCLEITEGVLMKELHVATQHLSNLKALGVQVAIDDFGTGYSSLAYLRSFEVNTLKIDRSFLIDIAENQADQAIVSSIIELARNLKLQVVAEGIETHQQLEQVFSRGCYIIQGYYFAKPMPRHELDKFMGLDESTMSLTE
ncbi:EAL domain-containing protein [Shewanella aestuarii]|uniref:cyclic-guanylate-specific phosphodiesterase n=1 Tax=Shewanella aestuarii TaxID=1028752 RepID=A0A6G9QGP6_9GAMM|nr:EAL domain-containing protein [Shewanella aestuarii]QIR13343.1 EAL domain-containing protein [Shewanella aestuarii]